MERIDKDEAKQNTNEADAAVSESRKENAQPEHHRRQANRDEDCKQAATSESTQTSGTFTQNWKK